jgi:hemoglobin-like flavoprotein
MSLHCKPRHERDTELFNDSLERCISRPYFLDRFYQTLLRASPEAAEKLRHTDIKKQALMLKASLYMLMLAGKPEAEAHLTRIASIHSRRGRDIRPELHDVWLDCLIETVREFDPQFDPQIEAAWRRKLRPGIEFIKSKY